MLDRISLTQLQSPWKQQPWQPKPEASVMAFVGFYSVADEIL